MNIKYTCAMHINKFLSVTILFPLLAFTQVLHATNYNFVSIDYPGSSENGQVRINDDGIVSSAWYDGSRFHSYVYDGITYDQRDFPGAAMTIGRGINNSGNVVGTNYDVVGGFSTSHHGYFYDGSSTGMSPGTPFGTNEGMPFVTFDYPGAVRTAAIAINNVGRVVGHYHDGTTWHGYEYDGTTFSPVVVSDCETTQLLGNNDANQIVGVCFKPADPIAHGFMLDNAADTSPSFIDCPGASYTDTTGITESGLMVGNCTIGGVLRGYITSDGIDFTYIEVDFPGAIGTFIHGINESGQITGSYRDGSAGSGHINRGYIATPVQYEVIDLGTLGGNESSAQSINDNGKVVGWSTNHSGEKKAFIFPNITGQMEEIPTGSPSVAIDINNVDQVVGDSNPGTAQIRGFLYDLSDGSFKLVPTHPLALPSNGVAEINDAGLIAVGYDTSPSGGLATLYNSATEENTPIPNPNTGQNYGSIPHSLNNLGQYAGLGDTGPGNRQPFIWKDGVFQHPNIDCLIGGNIAPAKTGGINDDGVMVVYRTDGSAPLFRFDGSTCLDLGNLGGSKNRAGAINNSGDIVGSSETFEGDIHAFIWTESRGMVDLNSLLASDSGWNLTEAAAINIVGQIVGYGNIGGEIHGFLLNPVQVNTPPVADAGLNQSIHAGALVDLDGSGSNDAESLTEDLAYNWSFDSKPINSAAMLDLVNPIQPSFVADMPGDYLISLVVTDEGGLSSDASQLTVSSLNSPPTAVAGSDVGTYLGNNVVLDGSNSSDPDMDMIVSYTWIIESMPLGSGVVLNGADTPSPSFAPDIEGAYTIQLIVNDGYVDSTPSTVDIVAVSPDDYASAKILEALNYIANLPKSSVTKKGNKKSLSKNLSKAIKDLQKSKPKLDKAKKKLEKAIEATDGCALRNEVPDPKAGKHAPKADTLLLCSDQDVVYPLLIDALTAITP